MSCSRVVESTSCWLCNSCRAQSSQRIRSQKQKLLSTLLIGSGTTIQDYCRQVRQRCSIAMGRGRDRCRWLYLVSFTCMCATAAAISQRYSEVDNGAQRLPSAVLFHIQSIHTIQMNYGCLAKCLQQPQQACACPEQHPASVLMPWTRLDLRMIAGASIVETHSSCS